MSFQDLRRSDIMALVPTYSSMFTNDQVSAISKSVNHKGRGVAGDCIVVLKGYKALHQRSFQNKEKVSRGAEPRSPCVFRVTTSGLKKALHTDKRSVTLKASQSSDVESQLEALESYFGKLHDEPEKQKISCSTDFDTTTSSHKNEVQPSSLFPAAEKELVCLQNYLTKLNTIQSQRTYSSSDGNYNEKKATGTPYIVNEDYETSEALNLKPKNAYPQNFQAVQSQEETSDLSLICILASINIAVFLFEIASPVKNSDLELLSLPSLYGAKINQLILDGEWWRLVTPMFLHSGILHVALGFWVLLTFGPQVCKGYGSLTFFLIYVLGGISGNLTSFIHTAEPTVGGTGPVFAIIGAWLVYQIQNKEAIQKDVAQSLFRKAITATSLSFVLSNFGPIDDWTHLGAMCVGIAYGFLTCPALQLDDSSSSSHTEQKDGFALVRRYANPLKSILVFAIFILLLSTLVIFVEPQVNTLEISFV